MWGSKLGKGFLGPLKSEYIFPRPIHQILYNIYFDCGLKFPGTYTTKSQKSNYSSLDPSLPELTKPKTQNHTTSKTKPKNYIIRSTDEYITKFNIPMRNPHPIMHILQRMSHLIQHPHHPPIFNRLD